jgi:hypothetical protein
MGCSLGRRGSNSRLYHWYTIGFTIETWGYWQLLENKPIFWAREVTYSASRSKPSSHGTLLHPQHFVLHIALPWENTHSKLGQMYGDWRLLPGHVWAYIRMFRGCAINVGSWLVARGAIVAILFQIILKLMYCVEGSLLWQNKIGRAIFFEKKL